MRLNSLTGKRGVLKIRCAGQVDFTFLSVDPPPDLPTEMDDDEFQTAITRSRFLVRFEEGTLIDGSHEHHIWQGYIAHSRTLLRHGCPRIAPRTFTGCGAGL